MHTRCRRRYNFYDKIFVWIYKKVYFCGDLFFGFGQSVTGKSVVRKRIKINKKAFVFRKFVIRKSIKIEKLESFLLEFY